jgi:hypothetical protein
MKDEDIVSLIKKVERLGIRKEIRIYPYPYQIFGIEDPVPEGCLKMAEFFKQAGIQGKIKVKRMKYMEKKFRAWDNELKKLIYNPEEIDIYYEEDNGFHSGREDEKTGWVNLKLDQYSGLNDPEGVELYENDLAQHKDGEGAIYTIKLYSGCFWATLSGPNGWYIERPLHQVNNVLKKVGNIHQNEDLLRLNDKFNNG